MEPREQDALPSAKNKKKEKYAERLAFSKYVATKKVNGNNSCCWKCCDTDFEESRDIHKHVAMCHYSDVEILKEDIMENGDESARWSVMKGLKRKNDSTRDKSEFLPVKFNTDDQFPWLPSADGVGEAEESKGGRVLLFYKYREIEDTRHVKSWQEELCSRLHLTGKIRVATEGLNATVGGSYSATEVYKTSVMAHPLFSDMTTDDFKESKCDTESFSDGLKVGIYKEVVPMGVDPSDVSYEHAGKHLNPDEFHKAVEEHLAKKDTKSVFIDCRNFYESKIGCFEGAIAPDIRKFSYWPEYIEKNKEFFKDKSVYMYCTGGIRCERGSAYFRQKNICQEVYQLKGGIHKYIEKYPEGYFRGKLFVFDDRYAIKANEDVISECVYCSQPWDKYEPCSSAHCHQLVLSCTSCRTGDLTACCRTCSSNSQQGPEKSREQCECTERRERVPIEKSKPSISTSKRTNTDKETQDNDQEKSLTTK